MGKTPPATNESTHEAGLESAHIFPQMLGQHGEVEPIFAALLHAAPDAIVISDSDARTLVVNQQAERLFGYAPHELIGQPIELLVPERLRALHEQHRTHYVGEPHTRQMGAGLDLLARRKDGSEFPVEVSLSPLQTPSGTLITSAIRDVSERRRVEDELRASQARLAGVLEIAEDAIISVDDSQCIQRFNHGAEKTFGYASSEVLGKSLNILLPERFRHAHVEHVRTFGESDEIARRMHERREIFGLRKDGSEFPAEASISKLTLGNDHIYTVILHDITEQKRAADELEHRVQRRTAHLNALLEFSKELLGARSLDAVLQRAISHAMALVYEADRGLICLFDPQTQRLALRASAGFRTLPLLHVPADLGILGRAFTSRRSYVANSVAELESLVPELCDPEQSSYLLLRSLDISGLPSGALAIPLVTHGTAVGVLLLLREGGSGPFAADARSTLEGLANLTAAAVLEEQSQRTAASLTTQLATLEEQQRTMAERLNYAEAGMLQAARLAAVGQLAASIAHEINNPLYAARNALYLIEEDLPDDLRSSPYMRMVGDQLTRIAGIIQRMRDFYRPTRGELAPYNLNQLLEETLALAGLNSRHGGINMIFSPAHDLPLVECNGDQLRQVFLNLVLNAIEAMPDGGSLSVRTVAGPTVALVEIQDTGIGIPDDIRAHLFEPFFTNKPNGTGLGLSISAHIVTQHGGQIEVDSQVGEGTTFRIVLPYESKM